MKSFVPTFDLRRVAAFLAAAVLTACGASQTQTPRETLTPPPSIIVPPPAQAEVADAGQPGEWRTLPGTTPAVRAFVVPASGEVHGGIVLVHTIWGLDIDVRTFARDIAARGYAVVAPDVYEGVIAETRLGAMELSKGVSAPRAAELTTAAAKWLASFPEMAGRKIGLIAVGNGSTWAWEAAATGIPVVAMVLDSRDSRLGEERLRAVKCPVLVLAGDENSGFTPRDLEKQRAAVAEAGAPVTYELVPHAGNDLFDPQVPGFMAGARTVALDRALAFISHAR